MNDRERTHGLVQLFNFVLAMMLAGGLLMPLAPAVAIEMPQASGAPAPLGAPGDAPDLEPERVALADGDALGSPRWYNGRTISIISRPQSCI